MNSGISLTSVQTAGAHWLADAVQQLEMFHAVGSDGPPEPYDRNGSCTNVLRAVLWPTFCCDTLPGLTCNSFDVCWNTGPSV